MPAEAIPGARGAAVARAGDRTGRRSESVLSSEGWRATVTLMNISLVHSKGGVTKSSIAANLCVWLAEKGHKVAAIDLDAGQYGNKSLSTAVGQAAPEIPVHSSESREELQVILRQLSEQFHFTVADAPGGFQTTAETNLELLKHTDFALVPVKPNFDDIEPLAVVDQVVHEARITNPLLEARVVVNCVDLRTRAGRDIQSTIDAIRSVAPSLQVMKQTIRIDRAAFESARLNGTVVVQGARSPAKEDLDSLFAELLSDMVVSINRQAQRFAKTKTQQEKSYEAKAVHQ